MSGVDRCSMLEEQELNVSEWVRCEEGIGKGKRKKGKELERRLDITVRPLGECLQNLITLNVITLLDLWMDISLPLCHTLSIILSLSLTLSQPHLQQLPLFTLLPFSGKMTGHVNQEIKGKASYNIHETTKSPSALFKRQQNMRSLHECLKGFKCPCYYILQSNSIIDPINS